MSASYVSDYSRQLQRQQVWNEARCRAAELLARGHTQQYTADQVGVTRKTVWTWTQDPDFAAEVDRLSLMVGIASRAQRLRWLNRTIANKVNEDGSLQTDKDVIDLLKVAISETDGAKIDLSKLAELLIGDNQEQSSSPVEPTYNNPLSLSTESLGEVIDVTEPDEQTEQPATTDDDNHA